MADLPPSSDWHNSYWLQSTLFTIITRFIVSGLKALRLAIFLHHGTMPSKWFTGRDQSQLTQLNLWLGAFCQLQSDNLGIKDGIFASKDSPEVVPCFQGQIRCSDKKLWHRIHCLVEEECEVWSSITDLSSFPPPPFLLHKSTISSNTIDSNRYWELFLSVTRIWNRQNVLV